MSGVSMEPWETPVVRAFVGIAAGEEVRAALVQAQERLRRTGAHVSWTPRLNIHLTLLFLGDIDRAVGEALCSELDTMCVEETSLSCAVNGIGTFGGRRPRVVWAGVDDPAGRLVAMQEQIAQAARALGVATEERAYTPHITLGRVRSGRLAAALAEAVSDEQGRSFGPLEIERVTLFRSRLSSSGAGYSVLHESGLAR